MLALENEISEIKMLELQVRDESVLWGQVYTGCSESPVARVLSCLGLIHEALLYSDNIHNSFHLGSLF